MKLPWRSIVAAFCTSFLLGCAAKGRTTSTVENGGASLEPPIPLFVDLAGGRSQAEDVSPGDYSLVALNTLPSAEYRISARLTNRPLQPLPLPDAPAIEGLESNCTAVNAATTALIAATNEEAVPPLADALKVARLSGTCTDEAELASAALAYSRIRRVSSSTVSIEESQDLIVTVTRESDGEAWVKTFRTADRGEWRTSYGFSFVIDPWNDHFYQQGTAVADSFVITRSSRTRWVDYVPTFFYSYMPAEELLQSLDAGFTLGLGFDLAQPVVLAGGNFTYNQNIALSYGVAFHPQQVLNRRYREGSIVREVLGDDQIHEMQYRFSPFVALSLHSLSNPFGRPVEPDTD